MQWACLGYTGAVSVLNLFLFWFAIQTSGDSTFTCPDLFSLARIIFPKNVLPNFTCHLNYFTPIVTLGICLYVKADLHLFMVQRRLYSYIFIYLLFIDLKKRKEKRLPEGQPYCGFSVALRRFQLPGVIGWPLSSNPARGCSDKSMV